MEKLTVKQEKFCLAYVETGNASEAYRRSYDTEESKYKSVNEKASRLLSQSHIRARVDKLMSELKQIHQKTMSDLLNDLEEARQIAIETKAPAAMISATMSHARLTGMDRAVAEDDEGQTLNINFSVSEPVDNVKVTVGKPK